MARKKVIDLDTYNALDAYSIALHEYYKSLRKAGFSVEISLALMSDRDTYPEWILPTVPNEMKPMPYDDDED
jgi:hypothetical protein